MLTRSCYYTMLFPLVVALASCGSDTAVREERSSNVVSDSIMRTLSTAVVVMAPQLDAITLTGKVATNDDQVAKLYPLVTGNISGIKVMLGDHVSAGQELAQVNSAEMAGYSNDLTGAETNLRMAAVNLAKTRDMYKSGLASAPDSLNAAMGYEQAKAALARARQVLAINGNSTRGTYVVKAPISGFLVEKNVTNNMAIRADNSNAMFTISDLKNVWIWANVYESNIGRVHIGDRASVETISYPGKIFNGNVDKIMNVLDPTNKVMKVRIVLQNENYALKPEMFCTVTIYNQLQTRALAIPSSALVFDHSRYYVVLMNNPRSPVITPVEVAGTAGNTTYIADGLTAGQKVVSSQALQVYGQLNN